MAALNREYVCWKSDTCYVCTGGGEYPPRIHASTKGYIPTSPCDTLSTVVIASNRNEAIGLYRDGRDCNGICVNCGIYRQERCRG